jgi:hypothetical protein
MAATVRCHWQLIVRHSLMQYHFIYPVSFSYLHPILKYSIQIQIMQVQMTTR